MSKRPSSSQPNSMPLFTAPQCPVPRLPPGTVLHPRHPLQANSPACSPGNFPALTPPEKSASKKRPATWSQTLSLYRFLYAFAAPAFLILSAAVSCFSSIPWPCILWSKLKINRVHHYNSCHLSLIHKENNCGYTVAVIKSLI